MTDPVLALNNFFNLKNFIAPLHVNKVIASRDLIIAILRRWWWWWSGNFEFSKQQLGYSLAHIRRSAVTDAPFAAAWCVCVSRMVAYMDANSGLH